MNDKHPTKTNAPLYANLFAEMVPIARELGYALAVHGSLRRDLDLVAIPWWEQMPSAFGADLVEAFQKAFYFAHVTGPEAKPHGRMAWTLAFPGTCFVDLSILPVDPPTQGDVEVLRARLHEVGDRLVLARRAIVALRGHRNKSTGMN